MNTWSWANTSRTMLNDNDDNEYPGYTITVPSSLDLTDTQKASRQLEGCTFKAKLAGAIQIVEVSGNLVYA